MTEPLPEPAFITLRVRRAVKVAVQLLSASIVTVPLAAQAPLQPENTDPESATGVSVTSVPWS